MTLRFKNTRTGREVAAKGGRDLAAMVKIEQDRRSGLEVAEAVKQTPPRGLSQSTNERTAR